MDNNKTKDLYVGRIVKNYVELCMLLGEKKKGGKSKILQVKDWSRFFEFKRQGDKYIIEVLYDEPKPKIDGRQNGNMNNDIYGEIVQQLIMSILINNNGRLLHPIGFFLNQLCMTNENYSHFQYNHPELAQLLNIDKFNVYYFYLTSNNNFRGIFERALVNLVKNKYIMWEKVTMIKSGYSHDVANHEEQMIINRAKEKALKDMNYKNIQKIILAGKYKKYEEILIEIIRVELDIDYFYSSYLIQSQIEDCEKIQKDLDVLRSKLNELNIKNLLQQAKSRQLATLEKYNVAIGKPRKPQNQFDECKINEEYLEINLKLISILVNKDTAYIGSLTGNEKVERVRKIIK